MRHILYLLLVANLAYLGWNLVHSNTSVSRNPELPPLPASVKRLVTLQESRQQSAAPGDAAASAPQPPAAAAAVGQGGLDAAAPVATGQQPVDGAGSQQAASTAAGDRIDKLTAAAPPGAGDPVARNCRALGPFAQEQEARTVAGQLDQLGVPSSPRQTEVREASGYWVYLPSMSQEAAQEVARRLDKLGDKDYFIGKQHYISLGIFKDRTRAEGRVEQMHKLGLDAVLRARQHTRRTWWLAFSDSGRATRTVHDILASRPGLQLHTLSACNFPGGLLE